MNPLTTNRVAAQASPFNCVWIPKGSIGNLGGFYICRLYPDAGFSTDC